MEKFSTRKITSVNENDYSQALNSIQTHMFVNKHNILFTSRINEENFGLLLSIKQSYLICKKIFAFPLRRKVSLLILELARIDPGSKIDDHIECTGLRNMQGALVTECKKDRKVSHIFDGTIEFRLENFIEYIKVSFDLDQKDLIK